ncbi:MAG TPA: hypothetical protein PKI45_04120 [Candidatus Omnitrophota bacterium]|nr:hypothetical protein [Candidatus Omnitrophota bacterium]
MRSLSLGLWVLALALMLSGCQAFMEDYNYHPVAAPGINSNM